MFPTIEALTLDSGLVSGEQSHRETLTMKRLDRRCAMIVHCTQKEPVLGTYLASVDRKL